MNSIIEAQEEFSYCFGELRLSNLSGELTLPCFSREAIELEQFIKAHQDPALIVLKAKHHFGSQETYFVT